MLYNKKHKPIQLELCVELVHYELVHYKEWMGLYIRLDCVVLTIAHVVCLLSAQLAALSGPPQESAVRVQLQRRVS